MSMGAPVLYHGSDPAVAGVLEKGLSGASIKVIRQPRYESLETTLERGRFSLLIMDAHGNGGADGIDLSEAVRREHPDLPVLLYGGLPSDWRRALRAGVRDLIEGRGANALAELLAAARRVLEGETRHEQTVGDAAALSRAFARWPAPVILTDGAGRIHSVSEAAERLLGYPPGGLLGLTFNQLLHPDPAPEPEGRLSRIMRRAGDGAQMVMRRADGGTVSAAWIAAPVPGAGGALAIGRDLEPARSAEREIAAAELGYRRLIRASLEGILIARLADGRVVELNPELEHRLGLRRQDWCDRPIWQIAELAPAIPDVATLTALAKRTLRRRDEITLRGRDGRVRTFEFATHVASEAGERLLVCNFRDVSELKHRESQARRRAEQLEVLSGIALHASQSLEITASLGEITARLALSLSASAALILTEEREGVVQRVAAAYGAPDAALDGGAGYRIADSAAFACLERGRAVRSEPAADGPRLDAALSRLGIRHVLSAPLAVEGRAVGLLLVGRSGDPNFGEEEIAFAEQAALQIAGAVRNARLYADLQAAYQELQRTQERIIAQERLRALGTMASGIAHDFNNALSPVLGFSELLIDNPELLDDRARALHYLELIRTGALDGSHVVSRLREFYRHRESPELLQPVNINALVSSVVEMTRPRWRGVALANGAPVSIRTELGDLPPIAGHEAELREMLTNLVLNALDAMPEGGELCIQTDQLPSGRVIIEVSDSGTGMTAEVRRRCLEPFFSTKGERGTGLGLAMVYGTVQRHGGCIDIASIPGHGTTVSVYLPNGDSPAESEAEAIAPGGRPLRVLVADDEPAIRELLKEQLTADGHEVTLAADGVEAMEKFRPGFHEVIITDRSMPRMNGIELADRLKALPRPPRVLLLSGFGDGVNEREEPPAAVDLILRKPLSRHRLRSSLGCRARTSEQVEDNAGEIRRVSS